MKWNNYILIVLGSSIVGALLGLLGAGRLPAKLFLGNDDRVQWETLITGLAAVLMARLTINGLRQQINQTGELAADHRRRRARAARAMLPQALAEIGEYSTACIQGLYALRPCFPDGSLDRSQVERPLATWPAPQLPEDVLPSLKECIEFSDDTHAQTMARLIRHFQVQHLRLAHSISRLRLNDGVHTVRWGDIEQGMLDAAELFARAAVLFPFSRGETLDVSDVGRAEIYEALSVAGCFPDLQKLDALADWWQEMRDAQFLSQQLRPHVARQNSW